MLSPTLIIPQRFLTRYGIVTVWLSKSIRQSPDAKSIGSPGNQFKAGWGNNVRVTQRLHDPGLSLTTLSDRDN